MLLCSAVIAGLCLSGCSSSPAEKSPSSTTSDTESLSSTTSVTDQSSDIASVSENQSENSEAPASSEEESEVQSHPMVARHPQVRSQNETPSVTYSLKPVVMKDYYELSVFVPDNFPLEINHYELWCDNKQIGDKTETDKKLRDLTILLDSIDSLVIRLYNEDELVASCQIDPTEEEGVLSFKLPEEIDLNSSQIASYRFIVNDTTGVSELSISLNKGFEDLTYFEVWGLDSMMGERTSIDHVFTYLGLIENSGPLFIRFYDEDGFVVQGKIDSLQTTGMILKDDPEDD